MDNSIFIIIICILSFSYLFGRVLDYLNIKSWSKELPVELEDYYNDEKYRKAQEYNLEGDKLSLWSDSINFVILLTFFIIGGFGWLNDWLLNYISHPIGLALCFFGVLYFVVDIINLPFSIYAVFVVEEKYGFNKTTPKTFVLDKLKKYLLTIILGGGILALLLWFILWSENYFWIFAFVVIIIISLFVNVFYSTLIIPLFNKLTPLEDGDLRNSIQDYSKKVKFPLQNIFIIDGSKRSSKANAFFTGLWKKKKIVLYDTLIEKHTIPELVSILAHEVGHYKKKHIVKNLVYSSIQTFFMLYVLSRFINNEQLSLSLSNAFGSVNYALHINLIAFAILYEPVTFILGILMNKISRKHEHQADDYAVSTTKLKIDFKKALKRLSVDNLSNLKPHPVYVFFYFSHPPLLKRLEAIDHLE